MTTTPSSTKDAINSFTQLNLVQPLMDSLKDMGYDTPTPIQAQSLPHSLAGRDILGSAQTGTGKTAAFAIPIINELMTDRNAKALILCPTRELAAQIEQNIFDMTKHCRGLKAVLLVGGLSMYRQAQNIKRGARIIIATPGRLIDHIEQRNIHLDRVKVLVLDEADRMLDMGFIPQLQEIIKHVPETRQTLLFSATFPKPIQGLAQTYLKNPERIAVGSVSRPVDKITQTVIETTQKDKKRRLMDELTKRSGTVLIFTNTKRRTDSLAQELSEEGHKVNTIHGDKSQFQRLKAIDGFKRGHYRILVATDVAARGIDISHIAHVFNFDLPLDKDDFIHRIGRTARNGKEGEAISFVTPNEKSQWRAIQRLINPTAGSGHDDAKDDYVFRRRQRQPSTDMFGRGRSGSPRGEGRFGGGERGGERRDSRGEGRRFFGDRDSKPFGDRPRRSFGERSEGARSEGPRGEGRREFSKPFGDRPRRPFGERSEGARSEGPRGEGRREFSKPFGAKPKRTFGERSEAPRGDRPNFRDRKRSDQDQAGFDRPRKRRQPTQEAKF